MSTVVVTEVQFRYRGPAQTAYLAWGLQSGAAYNNGAGLVDGVWASGSILLPEALTLPSTPNVIKTGLNIALPLSNMPSLLEGREYGTFLWVTLAPPGPQQIVQSTFIVFGDGAGQAPDTDARVIKVVTSGVFMEIQGLNVRYA
jgi:hypothetical protein